MKAWQDLESNPNVSIYRTMKSSWYINHGVKIERFDEDGRIEVKNTMTHDDHYDDVTDDQYHVFENVGWEAGAFTVCIDVLEGKYSRASLYTPERCASIRKKIDAYRERLEKIQ